MSLVRFHSSAELEMNEAAAWYERPQKNLGKRFLATVQDAINRIQLDPELYPYAQSDVQRCLTRVFPFGILFRRRPGFILIMAVMHLNRDPNYWQNREFEPDAPAQPPAGSLNDPS